MNEIAIVLYYVRIVMLTRARLRVSRLEYYTMTLRTLCGTDVLYDTEAVCRGGLRRRPRLWLCWRRGRGATAVAAALPPETGRTAETTATSRLVAAAAAAGRLPPDRRFRYPSDGGGGGDPEQVACAFRVLIASVFFIFI